LTSQVVDSGTKLEIGRKKGGLQNTTLRRDKWYIEPLAIFLGLTAFVLDGVWAAFRDSGYYAGSSLSRNYLSPYYSPCFTESCPTHTFGFDISWWRISPALLILIFPLGFRLTCYYYRKAYYRSFWLTPVACAVKDVRDHYTGETRFPLILQNIHRYFFYIAFLFALLLTYDAIIAFRFPGGIGMGLGTLVLCINSVLIWLYTISCHACRHVCGGKLKVFSKAPIRHKLWSFLTPLNRHHQLFAWLSLVFIAFTDFYIWLVASGHITDPRFF
jgi:hypothetical protein